MNFKKLRKEIKAIEKKSREYGCYLTSHQTLKLAVKSSLSKEEVTEFWEEYEKSLEMINTILYLEEQNSKTFKNAYN